MCRRRGGSPTAANAHVSPGSRLGYTLGAVDQGRNKPERDADKKGSRWPAVSTVCTDGTLIELLYDQERRTTAFAVWKDERWTVENGVTLATGERLVPFSPENNLIRNEAVLLPLSPEEYGSEAELLAEIQGFIHSYVDLSPTFEKAASYYVLFSWVHDAFNEVPYLRLRGDFGTGKTRGLIAIGSLCYKAFFASGASTVSPIFHTLDAFRGTLILDEADFRFSDEKAEIVKILNNGNAKGLPILRTIVTNNREFNPRAFHVFGPKIVATRGTYNDRALESRFITEETGERRMRADIPINLPPECKAEALALRNKLLLYRFRNRLRVRLDPSLSDGRMEPRLNQILVPLLSIIDDAALHAELRSVAAAYYCDLVAERGLSPEALALEILSELISSDEKQTIPIHDITARFIERHGAEYSRPITNKWIGYVLRTKLHLATYKSHGIYVVSAAETAKLNILREKYGIAAGKEEETVAPAETPGGDMGTWGL